MKVNVQYAEAHLADLISAASRGEIVEIDAADACAQIYASPKPAAAKGPRILGEVTPERVAILQEADAICTAEIRRAGLYSKVWQSFAVLLPVKTVGVMGDQRTYAYTCAIRAVESEDGMTADWAPLPYEVLRAISSRIVSEVRGINRVVYDITSKPPGTIEWE